MIQESNKTEKTVTDQVLRWFNKLPNGRAIKLHSSAYQGRGEPDIIGCIGGRMICIEMKQPGERPTMIQDHIRKCWLEVGAISIVATSLEDVQEAVKEARRNYAAVTSGH